MIWPHARPFIAAALTRDGGGRYEPADILAALLRGVVRLWISWNDTSKRVEAAVVTEIIDYPRLRELRLWLVGGGNLAAWGRPMRDLLEEFARNQGCHVVTGGLRKGWLRIGGPGWRQTGITFEKRLV